MRSAAGRGYKFTGLGQAPQEQPPGAPEHWSCGLRSRDEREHGRCWGQQRQRQQQQQVGLGSGTRGPWRLSRSLPTHPTHSSQASCGPESSGSELALAMPAPQMLQGLLGSDDEEQEDPKDYCKGEAWPWAHAA